jgi:hypothetical protein
MKLTLKDGPFLISVDVDEEEVVCNTARIRGENVHVSDTYRIKGINFDGRKVEAEITIKI